MEHLLVQDFDPMATLSSGSGGILGPNEASQFPQQPFFPSMVSPKSLQGKSEIDDSILPLLLDGTQDGASSQSLSLRAEIGPDLPSKGSLSRTDSAALASSLTMDSGNPDFSTIGKSTLTVDNDPFQDLDPLGDIPVALSDCKRIPSIPFSEIFDSKRELAILSPTLARASWSEDTIDDDHLVSTSSDAPRADLENSRAIALDQNLLPTEPSNSEQNLDLEHHLSSYGIQVMQDPYSVPVPSLLPSSTATTTERNFEPSRSRSDSDMSVTSTSAFKRAYGDRRRLLAENQMISPNNPETKRLKPWSPEDATKVQTMASQDKFLRSNNNNNGGANRLVPTSNMSLSNNSSRLQQPDEKAKTKAPLVGEHRLKINFSSLGGIGDIPQHFGKKRCLIPDGLAGTHELYNQKWHFEVDHRKAEGDVTVIHWRITNLASGTVTERTETTHEAFIREYKGQTICNQILREALEIRARELEAALKEKSHQKSSNSLQTSLKAVRPRKCIMGLLFFGLLHQCVQENLKRK